MDQSYGEFQEGWALRRAAGKRSLGSDGAERGSCADTILHRIARQLHARRECRHVVHWRKLRHHKRAPGIEFRVSVFLEYKHKSNKYVWFDKLYRIIEQH